LENDITSKKQTEEIQIGAANGFSGIATIICTLLGKSRFNRHI